MLLGLGLENKHSTAFFDVGIFLALLLTLERRHFAHKWIWLGGLIAFAIALPNILWQALHHWPTYELLSNISLTAIKTSRSARHSSSRNRLFS